MLVRPQKRAIAATMMHILFLALSLSEPDRKVARGDGFLTPVGQYSHGLRT
jgi:hypothetical protein